MVEGKGQLGEVPEVVALPVIGDLDALQLSFQALQFDHKLLLVGMHQMLRLPLCLHLPLKRCDHLHDFLACYTDSPMKKHLPMWSISVCSRLRRADPWHISTTFLSSVSYRMTWSDIRLQKSCSRVRFIIVVIPGKARERARVLSER
jgi:hypothetical protein